MQETHNIRSQEYGGQFVIAVFDDWEALQGVLEGMTGQELDNFRTVLHARKDNPPPAVMSSFLKEMTELHFVSSRQRICCTTGKVADELAARSSRGARSLADALHTWLSTDQAWQLQSHVEKGRLILWLQLQTSEQFGTVCGRLVQASPHMVRLCNINFEKHDAKHQGEQPHAKENSRVNKPWSDVSDLGARCGRRTARPRKPATRP